MIYNILYWILIIGGYIYITTDKKYIEKQESYRRFYISYCCIILVLQSGLRHLAVGADTYQYYNRFTDNATETWPSIWLKFYETYILGVGKDPGYDVVEHIFHWFSDDYRMFLIAVAFFFFSAFRRILLRYTADVQEVLLAISTYLLLFYSFFSITGIRQSIAVACGMYCFMAVQDKRYIKFVIFWIIAFFIHKSAAILIIFPILYAIKISSKVKMVVLIMFVLAALRRNYLIEMFREAADYEDYSSRPPYALMAFFFVFTILIFSSMKYIKKGDGILKVYNVYLPTFTMIPLLGWDSLFMREVLYFSVYSCVLIPKSLRISFKSNMSVIGFYILLCFMYQIPIDYAFFWQDMELGSNYK